MYNILDSTPYYYIKYLLDTDPSCILDIGCGKNVFKKSFPALLIGMDSGELCDERTLGSVDIVKKFDSEFVEQNQKMYPAVMSINAIHFAPIHSITQRLDWIKQLVRAKGRAFVTFNIETWLMFTDRKTIESIFGNVPQWEDVVNYVNQQILAANLDFLVVDWPVLHISKHSGIRDNYNGNVRLVFQVD
jgi:hypothetical protein